MPPDMSAAPAYASLLPEGLEVAAMVRDAGAAGERLPPQVTLPVADYEDIFAFRSALAAPIRWGMSSSDGEARAGHAASCEHHIGGYSRPPFQGLSTSTGRPPSNPLSTVLPTWPRNYRQRHKKPLNTVSYTTTNGSNWRKSLG